MAEIKPRPLGEVREANAKSFVRVRIHQEEGKKTLRRVYEEGLQTPPLVFLTLPLVFLSSFFFLV